MGQAGTFNVRDYGAKGDGRTLDSPAIQKTIDACAKAGGGTVRLAPGTYLSKPLFLRGNNSTLELDAGAVLQGTGEFADYQTSNGKVVGLINADKLTNVSISGTGTIDGAGAPWWPAVREAKKTGALEPRRRPKMVNFQHCQGVTVRDVTLQNSPSFHLVPADCDNVLIDHVTIKAPADSPNTDAIDPSACRNVRILNCVLDVGDDNVAVKAGYSVPGRAFCCQDILVSNCACLHGHGISIGSETSGGVSNFAVVHCTFDGTISGIRIKTTRQKGGRVENILYSDLAMNNVKRPIDIACYYPKVPKDDPAQPLTAHTPAYHGIRIENLTGNSPEGAGLIVGLPESPIRGVTLSNVHLKAVTGLLVENAGDVDLKNVRIEVEQGEPLILKNAKVRRYDP
jgi:polygalacturonase